VTDLLGTMDSTASVLPNAWESSCGHRVAVAGAPAPHLDGADIEPEANLVLSVDTQSDDDSGRVCSTGSEVDAVSRSLASTGSVAAPV
jgi:hypothetical protein